MDSSIGILCIDFATGSMLHLTGKAIIDWCPPPYGAAGHMPGALRTLLVSVDQVVERKAALPLRWSEGPEGTFNLRVARRVQESEDVVSFYLEAEDHTNHQGLPAFEPGQHLPIAVEIPGALTLLTCGLLLAQACAMLHAPLYHHCMCCTLDRLHLESKLHVPRLYLTI